MAEATEEIVTETNEKVEAVNKAAAIRKAFQVLHADTKPSDVVEWLKKNHNVEVSAAYVSVVKGQLMKRVNAQTFESVRIARKLVKETGSIQNARLALEALQEEVERTASLRALYEAQLAEVDVRLDDTERPLDQQSRRELLNEKRRVASLLKVLEDF